MLTPARALAVLSWSLVLLLAAPGHAAPPPGRSSNEHWAFQKLALPAAVPRVKDGRRVRNPVDAFVVAKLEVKGLRFAPDADRHTLARRASLDLLGLPPTPDEVQAFV